MHHYVFEEVNKIKHEKQIGIYGTGLVAAEVSCCLISPVYQIEITCFVVSDGVGHEDSFQGLPVRELSKAQELLAEDALIIVAVQDALLEEILSALKESVFRNILPMTFYGDLWSEICGNYFAAMYRERGKPFRFLEDELSVIKTDDTATDTESGKVAVYCVHSVYDKELKEDVSEYDHEIPIQVGASLTDVDLFPVKDNTGDNRLIVRMCGLIFNQNVAQSLISPIVATVWQGGLAVKSPVLSKPVRQGRSDSGYFENRKPF